MAHQNSLNRSRSSSCSSPVRNQFVYQEIYSVGANTLIRSYSCNQVFDKDESGQAFQTTQISFSSFITPEKKPRLNAIEARRKINTEPRKLTKKLHCDSDDKIKAKKRLKMITDSNKPRKRKKNWIKIVQLFMLPIISACLVCFYLKFKECNYIWNLEQTESELREKVLGQEEALAIVTSVLEMSSSSKGTFVMLFTGGVGVGKTLTSSIIHHNFPWSSKKLITFLNSFSLESNIFFNSKLSFCGYNLITFDDLSVRNLNEVMSLISDFINTRGNYENLIIILIVQSKTEAERMSIVNNMKDFIPFYHVPFKNLDKNIVRKCFEREIQRQGVEMLEKDLEKYVSDKIIPVNVVNGLVGCKGVEDDVSSYYKKMFEAKI